PSTSTVLTQIIAKENTTSTVTSSLSSAVFGQSITFTDTVAVISPGIGIPTGSVTFKDGTTSLGTGSLSVINGKIVAAFATSKLTAGIHSITAVYAGDANFKTSTTAAISQTIAKSVTKSTLASSAATASFGQPVTFTATVGVVSPGAGIPTGSVT